MVIICRKRTNIIHHNIEFISSSKDAVVGDISIVLTSTSQDAIDDISIVSHPHHKMPLSVGNISIVHISISQDAVGDVLEAIVQLGGKGVQGGLH